MVKNFRDGVRKVMIRNLLHRGKSQQEAEQLADANLDACEPVAQAAWDVAEADHPGCPADFACAQAVPAACGTAWKWTNDNVA